MEPTETHNMGQRISLELLIIYLFISWVPGIAWINKKIMILFLISLLSINISPPLFPWKSLSPGLHFLSPYSLFIIKILVELPAELLIQVPIKLPVNIRIKSGEQALLILSVSRGLVDPLQARRKLAK